MMLPITFLLLLAVALGDPSTTTDGNGGGGGNGADDPQGYGEASTNQTVATEGMTTTLIINVVAFIVFLFIFETNRSYKQIFLKRCVKRFTETNRVPPMPAKHWFGWLFTLFQVTERDVLQMVGLDAYMLLRYQHICLKLAMFLSFWGCLVLLPLYSTAATNIGWDQYTIFNVLRGDEAVRFRLWSAAIFGYVFAAYFCQLLYAEYSNFAIHRLQYLVQADPEISAKIDPDTPQQKYYSIMIENIPSHLRSAEAIYEYFDKLFPGDVYAVEVSLDLNELNALCSQRKRIRDHLEKAIAFYEATNERPKVYIKTGSFTLFPDNTRGMATEQTDLEATIQKLIAPEFYGYEPLDSIHYYTNKLQELNEKVKKLQESTYEKYGSTGIAAAATPDEDPNGETRTRSTTTRAGKTKKPVGPKVDTRAALIAEKVSKSAETFYNENKTFKLEDWFFGEDPKATQNPLHANTGSMVNSGSGMQHTRPKRPAPDSRSDGDRHHDRDNISGGRRGSPPTGAYTAVLQPTATTNTSTSKGTPPRDRPVSVTVTPETPELIDRVNSGLEEVVTNPLQMSPRTFIQKQLGLAQTDQYQYQYQEVDQQQSVEQHKEQQVEISGTKIPFQHTADNEVNPHGLPTSTSSTSVSTSGHSLHKLPEKISSAEEAAKEIDHLLEDDTAFKQWRRQSYPHPSSSADQQIPEEEEHKAMESDNHDPTTEFAVTSANPMHVNSTHDTDPAVEVPGATISASTSSSSLAAPAQKISQRVMSTFEGFSASITQVINQNQEHIDRAAEAARMASREGWEQTKMATTGMLYGVMEVERAVEMLALGAFYKYSSTAFVTFNSRVTESIAQQMLLTHDNMEIQHAPNPHDIIWENVAIPKSQIMVRNFITNIGLVIASIFWSSLVYSVDNFSSFLATTEQQQQLLSAVIMLCFLLILPAIFDILARSYECMKLESEVQNAIMTRYFYYQLVNVYVTVGFGNSRIWDQIVLIVTKPHTLVDIIGRSIPAVSLFFCNLLILKVFSAVPIEMLRPWQLSTIHMMSHCMDKRKTTRRELRTGAFYPWPMLYGWVYPQLMMVLIIMVTYACIAPLIMPFCVVFFAFAYLMYKYQLLYVYINIEQGGGFHWYAVFNRSLISLLFATITLLGYLSLQLKETYFAGPFFFLLPLPACIAYFMYFCEHKFKKQTMFLPLGFAKELDQRNHERKQKGGHLKTPHDSFTKTLYRQPALTEPPVYPEPYRALDFGGADEEDGHVKRPRINAARSSRRGSISIDFDLLTDEREDPEEVLEAYFQEFVVPLASEVDSLGNPVPSGYAKTSPVGRRVSKRFDAKAENDEFERLQSLRFQQR